MNASAYFSIHATTNTYPYTSTGAYPGATHPYHPDLDALSGLYEDPSSSTDGCSSGYLALGAWSDAAQALFEACLTAGVATSTSLSGPGAVVHMLPLASYAQDAHSLRHPTEAGILISMMKLVVSPRLSHTRHLHPDPPSRRHSDRLFPKRSCRPSLPTSSTSRRYNTVPPLNPCSILIMRTSLFRAPAAGYLPRSVPTPSASHLAVTARGTSNGAIYACTCESPFAVLCPRPPRLASIPFSYPCHPACTIPATMSGRYTNRLQHHPRFSEPVFLIDRHKWSTTPYFRPCDPAEALLEVGPSKSRPQTVRNISLWTAHRGRPALGAEVFSSSTCGNLCEDHLRYVEASKVWTTWGGHNPRRPP